MRIFAKKLNFFAKNAIISQKMKVETSYSGILGATLAKKRKSKKLGQQKIADETGINRSSWSRIENGEVVPDAVQLQKIAKAFGTTSAQILEEVDETQKRMEEEDVTVHTEKKSSNSGLGAFLLGAALGVLITKVLSGKSSKDGEDV